MLPSLDMENLHFIEHLSPFLGGVSRFEKRCLVRDLTNDSVVILFTFCEVHESENEIELAKSFESKTRN